MVELTPGVTLLSIVSFVIGLLGGKVLPPAPFTIALVLGIAVMIIITVYVAASEVNDEN